MKVRVQNTRLREQIEALETQDKISAKEANDLLKGVSALDPRDQQALALFLAERRDSFVGAEPISASLRDFIAEQSSKDASVATKAHDLRASLSSEAPESGHWWSSLSLPLGQMKTAALDDSTKTLIMTLANQSHSTKDGALVVGESLLDQSKIQSILA